MPDDIRDMLRDAAATPSAPPDMDAILARSTARPSRFRRRDRQSVGPRRPPWRRAALTIAGLLALGLGLWLVAPVGQDTSSGTAGQASTPSPNTGGQPQPARSRSVAPDPCGIQGETFLSVAGTVVNPGNQPSPQPATLPVKLSLTSDADVIGGYKARHAQLRELHAYLLPNNAQPALPQAGQRPANALLESDPSQLVADPKLPTQRAMLNWAKATATLAPGDYELYVVWTTAIPDQPDLDPGCRYLIGRTTGIATTIPVQLTA
jgi:hypothetical protein